MPDHQRVDAQSNVHAGETFERKAVSALAREGIQVQLNYSLEVGVAEYKKRHRFDLGTDSPPTIVECKSHRWTANGNLPSAKMSLWNEAMYYFYCSPINYRKIMFVLRDLRPTNGEPLADYYVRTYRNLIPQNVELWEFNEVTNNVRKIIPQDDGQEVPAETRPGQA